MIASSIKSCPFFIEDVYTFVPLIHFSHGGLLTVDTQKVMSQPDMLIKIVLLVPHNKEHQVAPFHAKDSHRRLSLFQVILWEPLLARLVPALMKSGECDLVHMYIQIVVNTIRPIFSEANGNG